MDTEITEAVTEWQTATVGGGYEGLHELAAEEFTGAVTAGLTWAFVLNGRVVGVFDGGIEDFEDADLTAYRAPEPGVVLLYAMQETGGDVRARYYTQDTPVSEADRTLSAGSFTGYLELSENVLSGDYYVVYYGGHAMPVAYVGASNRLVTGDEAFELADDEVGIYQVREVPIDVVDVPEPPGGSPSGAATGSASEASDVTFGGGATEVYDTGDDATDAGEADDDESDTTRLGGSGVDADDAESAASASASEADDSGEAERPLAGMDVVGDEPDETTDRDAALDEDAATPVDSAAESPVDESEDDETDPTVDTEDGEADDEDGTVDTADAGDDAGTDTADTAAVEDDENTSETPSESADAAGDAVASDVDSDGRASSDEAGDTESAGVDVGGEPEPQHALNSAEQKPDPADAGVETAAATGSRASTPDDPISREKAWRSERTVPALDPAESGHDGDAAGGPTTSGEQRASNASTRGGGGREGRGRPERRRTAGETAADATAVSGEDPERGADVDGDVEALRAELDTVRSDLEAVTQERDELRQRVDELTAELESAKGDRDEYRQRVDELESEVRRLREEVEAAGGAAAGGDGAERLSAAAAKEGTNLFVRYRSKGKPTLEKARAGEAEQDAVVQNLRLEYHTTFESESATVDGEPFETFLTSTVEWGFVRWVVEDLLYEIGRSGNRNEMADVFDRIPEIDRIQFAGEVPVSVREGDETHHGAEQFDLVFWDSMGDPLFVANFNTSRAETTESMVSSLIESAHNVGTSKDKLGAAFFVTSSFYEPGALETVGDATGGGFLSRSSRKSFVKLSRKDGYHLCLVEARGGEYHLSVPEL